MSQEDNPNANQNDEQDVEEIEGEVTPLLDNDDSDSEDEDNNGCLTLAKMKAPRIDRICTAFGLTLTGPPLSVVEPPFPHILLLIRGWKIRFNPPYLMCLYNEIIPSVVQ